jgi:lipoate-protein ligase A
MYFVDYEGMRDPRTNLAIEEYILRNPDFTEDGVFLYINEPSIIIGRNQNPLEEVNLEYAEAHHIHVVRRLSGGGTVYHDLGNLNFSFITINRKEDFHNFRKFTAPVIRVLQRMGVDAQLNNRNDIVVNGLKISGNAQYITIGRMLTHGTLLFQSNLSSMAEALKTKAIDIHSKSIKSVRSQVANISDFLKEPTDMETFRLKLLEGILEAGKENFSYRLSEDDWARIKRISAEHYQTWEWNFGRSPRFSIQKQHRYRGDKIEVRLDVEDGLIRSIKFYGVLSSEEDKEDLEKALTGVRYERQNIQAALSNLDDQQNGFFAEEFVKSLGNWLI